MPEAYSDFTDVFSEELAGVLPSNIDYDHAIELDRKAPPHLPIYNLSKRELDLLKEYLDGALQKG